MVGKKIISPVKIFDKHKCQWKELSGLMFYHMQWPAWVSQIEWKKKRPQNSGFTLYFSSFDSICMTPELWQQGICFLGKHDVCPGAQRIGKEVRKEGQQHFPGSFGLASLKWGKKSAGMKLQSAAIDFRKMGRKKQKYVERRSSYS